MSNKIKMHQKNNNGKKHTIIRGENIAVWIQHKVIF